MQQQYRGSGNVFLVRRSIRTLDWFLGERYWNWNEHREGGLRCLSSLDRRTANAGTFYYPFSNATFGTKDSILNLAYSENKIKYMLLRKLIPLSNSPTSTKRFLNCRHSFIFLFPDFLSFQFWTWNTIHPNLIVWQVANGLRRCIKMHKWCIARKIKSSDIIAFLIPVTQHPRDYHRLICAMRIHELLRAFFKQSSRGVRFY